MRVYCNGGIPLIVYFFSVAVCDNSADNLYERQF